MRPVVTPPTPSAPSGPRRSAASRWGDKLLLLGNNLPPLSSSSNLFPSSSNLSPSSSLHPSSLLSHSLPQQLKLPQHGPEAATTTWEREFLADRSSKNGLRW